MNFEKRATLVGPRSSDADEFEGEQPRGILEIRERWGNKLDINPSTMTHQP